MALDILILTFDIFDVTVMMPWVSFGDMIFCLLGSSSFDVTAVLRGFLSSRSIFIQVFSLEASLVLPVLS
jgi:hypothetical protein